MPKSLLDSRLRLWSPVSTLKASGKVPSKQLHVRVTEMTPPTPSQTIPDQVVLEPEQTDVPVQVLKGSVQAHPDAQVTEFLKARRAAV